MSQWVHVVGNLELAHDGFLERKKPLKNSRRFYDDRYYIPCPEEQIIFGKSEIYTMDERAHIDMRATVVSLPIAKRIIEKYIKDLPSGENDVMDHTYYQNQDFARCSSSQFEFAVVEKKFKEEILKRHGNYWENYREFTKYADVEEGESHCEDFTLSIAEDLRYCDGDEFLTKFLKFIDNIKKEGIRLNKGVLVWYDEYKQHHYSFRFGFDFMEKAEEIWEVIDNETGKVIAYHKVFVKWNKEDKETYEEFEDSPNWKDYSNWTESEEEE